MSVLCVIILPSHYACMSGDGCVLHVFEGVAEEIGFLMSFAVRATYKTGLQKDQRVNNTWSIQVVLFASFYAHWARVLHSISYISIPLS